MPVYLTFPGLGTACIEFDQVRLGSTVPPVQLRAALPMSELNAAFFKFGVRASPPNGSYWSEIRATCTTGGGGLAALLPYAALLGRHAATEVEVAVDFPCSSAKTTAEMLPRVVGQLDKRYHRRGHLRVVVDPAQITGPRGCLPLPTFYFEDRSARTRLKVYGRERKCAGGAFNGYAVRAEWTLKGDAIKDQLRLRGKQVHDLHGADLADFVRRNLIQAEIDHSKLGRLFLGKAQLQRLGCQKAAGRFVPAGMTAQDYWAMRAGMLFLHVRAARDVDRLGGEEWATEVTQNSPAQVRGYLKELQHREEKRLQQSGRKVGRARRRFSRHHLKQVVRKKPGS
ncbi:hypothetical protein JNB71_01700 [Rhizobium herbae]|uniref:Replication protein n=1 Tax=Rhizobium herbae TaxID=508661 RepID=A0ABS7H463_9HYPH|nr:hypothetical protein [Rhizobium herbae]MBW9062019.1 hypothetical protein [Rhizobium herbae]